ncbi:MAG: hypothetical protein ACRD0Z_03830 [Acidimicrobiales bacterium]
MGPFAGSRRLTRAALLRAAVAGGVLAAAAALAGCASPSTGPLATRSPQEILKAAATALKSSNSFHASALGKNGSETLSTDLDVFRNGDSSGQVVLNGSPIGMVAIGKIVYFKASKATWETLQLSATDAASIAGKWAAVPSSAGVDVSGLNYQSIEKQISDPGKVSYSKPRTTTLNGHKVIVVQYGGSTGGTWYIADTGPAYPVRFVSGGSTSELVNLSGWNSGTQPSAPPDTVVVPGS